MVNLFCRGGQLCNRLFTISSFISNAKENKYKLRILYFDEYYNLFENINNSLDDTNIKFLLKKNIKNHISVELLNNKRRVNTYFKLFGKLYKKTGNINNQNFIKNAVSHNLSVVGWPYWDVENFIKNTKFIKQIFTPKFDTLNKINKIILKFKEKYDILIGVHIRKGDYKDYLGGKFFYENVFYESLMSDLNISLIKQGYKPVFIICSNEKISLSGNLNFEYSISDNNAIEDLTLLSRCDYIFGPPSTFSMWASFYGNVPLKFITSTRFNLSLDSFSEIIASGTFKNGDNVSNYV